MQDAEIIKIIIENTKALTNMNGSIQNLYRTTDNLINSLHQNNTMSEIVTRKIEDLKIQQCTTFSMLEEIKKKLDMAVLQSDLKEMSNIKAKKLSDKLDKQLEKLDKQLEKHKWNWSIFWNTIGKFFDNSKWIFLILGILLLVVLIILKVIRLDEAWEWLKHFKI